VKRVVGIGNTLIGSDGEGVDLGWTLHGQGFMRSLMVELLPGRRRT
jgi:Ni,Fe-hydrogenase maturation factor